MTSHYTVYVPDGLIYLSMNRKLQDLRAIDLLNAARKEEPLLECFDALLVKCGNLPIEPASTLKKRALAWAFRNWEDNQMDKSHGLQDYFPAGPAPQASSVIDVVIISSYYLATSGLLPLATHLDPQFQFASVGWERERNEKWQTFYTYWRHQDFDTVFSLDVIPLACNRLGLDDVNHRLEHLLLMDAQLMVRQSYRDLFNRVCDFRSMYPETGVLVTGQSGIGNTTWLWFALVCMIAKGESVAFFVGGVTRLFHRGYVYAAKEEHPEFPPSARVWALIDDEEGNGPPLFLVREGARCFPIQATSPGEGRLGKWPRRRAPAVYGMPLWSESEIMIGFRLHNKYSPLLEQLGSAFMNRDPEKLPDMHGFLRDVVTNMWSDAAAIDFPGDHEEWAETVIETLLRRLIELRGEIPGEVYQAISGLGLLTENFMIDYSLEHLAFSELIWCLRANASERTTSVPYMPVILSVIKAKSIYSDSFAPRFRSDAIGRRIIERFGDIPPEHLSFRLTGVYQRSPPASILSRWILESYAHAAFSTSPNLRDPLRAMVRVGMSDPHTYKFSSRPVSPTSMPFHYRQIVAIELDDEKLAWPPWLGETLTLEDCFFVLKLRDNALFDSFYVDFSEDSLKPTVWIVRATSEPVHGGTSADYPLILSIKDMAERRADKREQELVSAGKVLMTGRKRKRGAPSTRSRRTEAEMKYVLAAPLPEQEHTWEMPADCPAPLLGEVFCIFIDVSDD